MIFSDATTVPYHVVDPTYQQSGGTDCQWRQAARLRPVNVWQQVDASTTEYHAASGTDGELERLSNHLDRVARDPGFWDGAEPPNTFAVMWAKLALDELAWMEFLPARIVASADGGIGLCFTDGQRRYADIEFLNSREILAVTSDGNGQPNVWAVSGTLDGLIRALGTIRDFIRPT
jgi:hypothetical protein